MYVLAGYVAEVIERQSWEQLIHAHLLQPLGMTSTMFVRDLLTMTSRGSQLAESCGWTDDGCVPVDIQLLEYAPATLLMDRYTGRLIVCLLNL